MRDWLSDSLLRASSTLPERVEGYALGRGLPFRLLSEMKVGLWEAPSEPCPDPVFRKRYGAHGEKLNDWISIPVWSPKGNLSGVEFRVWDGEKGSQKFWLPDVGWTPSFFGLTPSALNRIWDGGDIWLVEGVFDLALAHAVPSKDVVLACGGAKITPNQVRFIQRFLSDRALVHIAFDMDETGKMMAEGYIHPDTGRRVWGVGERLERVGVRSRLVRYRGGKDPGEVWESMGTAGMRRAFNL